MWYMFVLLCFQIMCIDDSSKLYVKISIALNGSTVFFMKQSLSSLNSTNEHKFMLNGDSLENIKIRIQVKSLHINGLEVSYYYFFVWNKNIIIFVFFKTAIFLDPDLCQLSLGSYDCGRAGDHWKKMIENPKENISLWHEAHPVFWDE